MKYIQIICKYLDEVTNIFKLRRINQWYSWYENECRENNKICILNQKIAWDMLCALKIS